MTSDRDNATDDTSPSKIPVVAVADLQSCLDRIGSGKRRQLHLVGPRAMASDLFVLADLSRTHRYDLDRTAVFRVEETPDLAYWPESMHLQALSCLGCNLRDEHCELFRRIVGLASLHLKHNHIRDDGVAAIARHLPGLTHLNLRNNHVTDDGATAIARHLPGLTHLDLGYNHVTDDGATTIAQHLPRLYYLDLENSVGFHGATDIDLSIQDLASNGISDKGAIAIAHELSRLTYLNLASNRIGDQGVYALTKRFQDGAFQRLEVLRLEGNNIRCLDLATLATGDANVIFEAVRNGVALPHARIMLVGMGGVGKSLLARRTFLDCLQHEGPHEETHDIVVLRPEDCRWMPRIEPEVDQPQVQTWIWDFAGQLVTHGVHESFLADDGRTVYVVVLAADREPDHASAKHDGNRLRYWLQMLRYTVESVAPVIIVITRNDKWKARQDSRPVDSLLAWAELTPARALKDVELDEFSNRLNVSVINVVNDFSACDATYPIREGLQRVIQDAVLQLGVVKEKRVPREFVPLKNLVDDRLPGHTMITRTDFDNWCAEATIKDATLRDELLRMLHHMGSLIYWGRTQSEPDQSPGAHYHANDQRLARIRRAPPGSLQTYVLNPMWFKTCVYAVTQASEELIDGKPRVWLTATEIDRIVTHASTGLAPSSATHPVEGTVIREALKFIGVSWEDEASGDFLFPRGLPEQIWTEYLAWGGHRLKWDFLPEHCVAKLLVRLHEDGLVVSPKKGLYVHDRNAALITYPPDSANHAFVYAVPEQGHVEIRYSKETQPDQRQSVLQHLLVILQARELQGRPPVISDIAAESAQQQQPVRANVLPSVLEADFPSGAGHPAVVGLVDQSPRPSAAEEWKGTLLVDPDPMFVASFEVVSHFYQIGLCYQRPDCPSQKEIAKRFDVVPSTVSRWETEMRNLLTRKFPSSTVEALVAQKNGRKCRLSAVGNEAMAWSEYCFPMLLELRKAIPG
jgi:GTPase SAR1 family protein